MEARDIDLSCWFCGEPFGRERVEQDGWMVPRARREGGPYLLYTCPFCERKSRVERNRAGALLAGPVPIVPVIDTLLAQFDAELRRDLTHKREFLRRRRGRREWFFGIYEEELLAAGARPGGGAPPEEPPRPEPQGAAGNPGAERPGPEEPEPEREPQPRRAAPLPSPPPPPTPHEVLGLEEGASAEQVLRAFRELAKRYHPDRFDALDPEFRELAHRKFLELKAAFDALNGGG